MCSYIAEQKLPSAAKPWCNRSYCSILTQQKCLMNGWKLFVSLLSLFTNVLPDKNSISSTRVPCVCLQGLSPVCGGQFQVPRAAMGQQLHSSDGHRLESLNYIKPAQVLLGILVLGVLATNRICLKKRSLFGCDVVLKYLFWGVFWDQGHCVSPCVSNYFSSLENNQISFF